MINLEFNTVTYFVVSSFLLIIIYAYRLVNSSDEGGVGDELGQYTMAIKAIWQSSICPQLTTYNNIKGYYCYPLAFPWICGRMGQIEHIQRFLTCRYSTKSLFPKLNNEQVKHLDTSLVLIKLMSNIIFPLITHVLICYACFSLGGSNLWSLIVSVGASMLADSIFTDQKYSISTRNVGFMLYSLVVISLIMLLNVKDPIYDLLQWDLHFPFYLVSLLTCTLLLFISSQRYFQCFLALIITTVLFVPALQYSTTIAIVFGVFILFQLQFVNLTEFARAHVYNRIHDSEWSSRLYGHFRYGFCEVLSSSNKTSFLNDVFKYSYLKSHMTGVAYYKRNWFSLFLVHRIYIYLLVIIILPEGIMPTGTTILSKLILFATIMPSILCFFRPFQGYGSSEVYIWGNLPFAYLTCIPFLINEPHEPVTFICLLLKLLILFELINIGLRGLYLRIKRLHSNKVYSLTRLSSESDIWDPAMTSFISIKDINNIVDFVQRLTCSGFTNKTNSLSIMAMNMHPQSLIECIILYTNRIKDATIKLRPAFVQLDNSTYGYFQDYTQFFVNPAKIIYSIKPDLLLVDISRPQTYQFVQSLASTNRLSLLYKSGSLLIVSISGNIVSKSAKIST